jgi:hypothetical protein
MPGTGSEVTADLGPAGFRCMVDLAGHVGHLGLGEAAPVSVMDHTPRGLLSPAPTFFR